MPGGGAQASSFLGALRLSPSPRPRRRPSLPHHTLPAEALLTIQRRACGILTGLFSGRTSRFYCDVQISVRLLTGCWSGRGLAGPVSQRWVPGPASVIRARLVAGWPGTSPPSKGSLQPLLFWFSGHRGSLESLVAGSLAFECCSPFSLHLPAHPGSCSRGHPP